MSDETRWLEIDLTEKEWDTLYDTLLNCGGPIMTKLATKIRTWDDYGCF